MSAAPLTLDEAAAALEAAGRAIAPTFDHAGAVALVAALETAGVTLARIGDPEPHAALDVIQRQRARTEDVHREALDAMRRGVLLTEQDQADIRRLCQAGDHLAAQRIILAAIEQQTPDARTTPTPDASPRILPPGGHPSSATDPPA